MSSFRVILRSRAIRVLLLAALFFSLAFFAHASIGMTTSPTHAAPAVTFLEVAIILFAAKIFAIVERFKQPAVLGELLVGVVLGNVALLGIDWFEGFTTDTSLRFLAELGVAILLFRAGLESNVAEMRRVGFRAFLIAFAGVIITFVLGAFVVAPFFLPDMPAMTHYFIGAALTATSVGVSARVFSDFGVIKTSEARLVIGAAVIDDVIGLVVLAVVTGMIAAGAVSFGIVSMTLGKAVIFLVGAVVFGQLFAGRIGAFFSKIHSGVGTKFTFAASFFLAFGFLAQLFGLAPIIGAFAAGLVLDPVHFKTFRNAKVMEELEEECSHELGPLKDKVLSIVHSHEEHHVDDLIEPLAYFLVPIFFVLTGMSVDLSSLFEPGTFALAFGLTLIAFIGKYCSSVFAWGARRSVVGFGMVPRGEVQLIFASVGSAMGVITPAIFSAIVVVVILTTIFSPVLIGWSLRRREAVS